MGDGKCAEVLDGIGVVAHRIQVFYDPAISIAEYDGGLRKLEAWFSTAKRGQAP